MANNVSSVTSSASVSAYLPLYFKALFMFLTLLLLSTTCTAFVSRGGVGVLKMCPPGGDSFATAWQLTCGMRKKRSVIVEDDPGKSGDKGISHDSLLPTPDLSNSSPEDELLPEKERRSAGAAGNKGYRPLSMTEMMHFCCRYGCTFRDLLPYCDPFGQWDSK